MASDQFAMYDKILCVGDSRTAGSYDNATTTLQEYERYCLCNMLAKMTNANVVNAGVGGATTITYWTNQPSKFIECENADAVFIWIGINDIYMNSEKFNGTVDDVNLDTYQDYNNFPNTSCGALGKIIMKAKEQNPTATIYVCTLDQVVYILDSVAKANKQIKEVANALGCQIVDLYNDELLQNATGRDIYWGVEGCHMTTLGYNRVASLFKRALNTSGKKYVGVTIK